MFRLALAALALSIATPALANMPPAEYDHPYRGHVKMLRYPVAYTDDRAAYRMCDRLHRQHYGAPYLDKGSMGIASMPRYGCTMYDPDTRWMMVVYTYDTPAIAKKRLATTKSKQQYDQCMAFNSFVHERGHANAYAAGDWRDGHPGWIEGGHPNCSYDKKPPAVPSS